MAYSLCATSPVIAQQPDYGPPSNSGQPNGDGDVKALHDALHLTPAQEPAWANYRANAKSGLETQQRRQSASQLFPKLNAPRRMDLVEAELQQEIIDLHHQSVALKSFYAALTPQQQHIFDERTLPPQQDH